MQHALGTEQIVVEYDETPYTVHDLMKCSTANGNMLRQELINLRLRRVRRRVGGEHHAAYVAVANVTESPLCPAQCRAVHAALAAVAAEAPPIVQQFVACLDQCALSNVTMASNE